MDFPPYSPCPCRSGKKAKFCCRTPQGTWRVPKEASITLPGTPTGYSHPKCYASADANCSTGISGEHYIPEGVLQIFGEEVKISGLKLPHRSFSTQSFVANVLCKRHNEALSNLDTLIINFCSSMERFVRDFAGDSPQTGEFGLYNGHDIERAMLKILCGIVAGNVIDPDKRPFNNSIPSVWVDLIFGRTPWPQKWGLYVLRQQDFFQSYYVRRTDDMWKMGYGFGVNSEGAIAKFGFDFMGHKFRLHISDRIQLNASGEASRFRPQHIVFSGKNATKVIEIGWIEKGDGGFVRLTVHSAEIS